MAMCRSRDIEKHGALPTFAQKACPISCERQIPISKFPCICTSSIETNLTSQTSSTPATNNTGSFKRW